MCRGSLSSYMKVVPSIAATRLCYEMIIGEYLLSHCPFQHPEPAAVRLQGQQKYTL